MLIAPLLILVLALLVISMRMASALEAHDALVARGWKLDAYGANWKFAFVMGLVFGLLSMFAAEYALASVLGLVAASCVLPVWGLWGGFFDEVSSSAWVALVVSIVLVSAVCGGGITASLLVIVVFVSARWAVLPLAIRRGWWRAALATAHSLDLRDRQTRASSAMLAALRALAAADNTDIREEALCWLEHRRLPGLGLGASLFSVGIIAAARGNEDTSWMYLVGILGLSPGAATLWERQTVAERMCALTARDGAWDRVRHYAGSAPQQSAALRFWSGAADMVQGKRSHVPACPRHLRYLLPRLRALPPPAPRPTGSDAADLAGVMRFHLQVCLRFPDEHDVALLHELGAAWDRVQDQVPPRCTYAVLIDLCEYMGQRVVPLHELHEVPVLVAEASNYVQQLYIQELITRSQSMIERVERIRRGEASARLPVIDEWMEYSTLRILYDRARRQGGDAMTAAVWPFLHHALNHLGTTLPDCCCHEIFRMLVVEAEAQGDTEAARLERSNVQASKRPPQPSYQAEGSGAYYVPGSGATYWPALLVIAAMALGNLSRGHPQPEQPRRPVPVVLPSTRIRGSDIHLLPTPAPSASPSTRASARPRRR